MYRSRQAESSLTIQQDTTSLPSGKRPGHDFNTKWQTTRTRLQYQVHDFTIKWQTTGTRLHYQVANDQDTTLLPSGKRPGHDFTTKWQTTGTRLQYQVANDQDTTSLPSGKRPGYNFTTKWQTTRTRLHYQVANDLSAREMWPDHMVTYIRINANRTEEHHYH